VFNFCSATVLKIQTITRVISEKRLATTWLTTAAISPAAIARLARQRLGESNDQNEELQNDKISHWAFSRQEEENLWPHLNSSREVTPPNYPKLLDFLTRIICTIVTTVPQGCRAWLVIQLAFF
jgi:hypothetical protein